MNEVMQDVLLMLEGPPVLTQHFLPGDLVPAPASVSYPLCVDGSQIRS